MTQKSRAPEAFDNAAEPRSKSPWHAYPVGEVEAAFSTSPHGLSAVETTDRLTRYGPNELQAEAPSSLLRIFLQQFSNTFILILVVAAVVTLALGELLDTLLIAVALLLNAVIGAYQERRAADAVRALMRLVVRTAEWYVAARNGTSTAGSSFRGMWWCWKRAVGCPLICDCLPSTRCPSTSRC